jgi:hypothetical protein
VALGAAAREEFRELVGRHLTKAAGEIARIPDPGTREAAAGTLLPSALLKGPDELLSEALDLVAEGRDGPGLLAAMSVAAPTAIAVGARVRLEGLDDVPSRLGRLTVEEAWQMDADEPVDGVFLLCAREGETGRQLFSFTIETPISGGAVKDGFVTGTTEGKRFVKKLTGTLPEDVELHTIEPEAASERVVEAAIQGARSALAPTDDGLAALTIFLRASEAEDADAIVQALELGSSLPERVDELEDEAMTVAVNTLALEAENWFGEQGLDAERVSAGAFAVGLMGDFRAFYIGVDLTSWTARELDEFLLDWVPRKVSLSEDEVNGFPDSVVDALAFLGATGRLTGRQATSLSARVRRSAARFAAATADPANAGPAKAMLDAMTAEGVEIGDPDAMQAWLDEFNARPFEERDRVLGPSLAPHRPSASPGKAKARKAQKQARRRNRKS